MTAVPARVPVGVRFLLAGAVLGVAVVAGLLVGPVRISLAEVWAVLSGGRPGSVVSTVLLDIRVPRTVTAVLVGAALGVTGLMMQTLFHNPLADPYVLGVSSGASLGVAVVVLWAGTSSVAGTLTSGLGLGGDLGMTVAATVGAAAVMVLIVVVGRFIRSAATVLLLGVMVGYVISAAVTVLLASATPELVAQYVRWGFGSYHGVTGAQLRVLVPVVVVGLGCAWALAKPLNALLLGPRYAQTMGVRILRVRTLIILVSAVLAGCVTALCGPIGFMGIAVPHLARGAFGTSNHHVVLPACVIVGAAVALLADVLAQLPGDGVLPLNAVNALCGAPLVVAVVLRRRRGMAGW